MTDSMAVAVARLEEQLRQVRDDLAEVGGRLRSVERWMWGWVGAAAAGGGVLSSLLTKIGH